MNQNQNIGRFQRNSQKGPLCELCKWGKIAWYFMVPGCIDTIGMILSDWCHISAGRVKNIKWPCCDL